MSLSPPPSLTERIGEHVECEFGGRLVEGVVRDVEHLHDAYRFEPVLKVARKGGATLSVPPEALRE